MITTTSANNSPILIVANAVSGGGAEKSMLALHSKLIEKSFDSYFLALNYNDQKHLETTNVISLNRKWRSGIKETLLNFLEFKNIIKKICPKIVILNCELPELYGSFLFLRNCRVICVEHTSNPWYRRKYIGIIVRSILKLKKIEWVTVVSNQKKIWLGDLNPKYIPNPFIKNKSCKADKHQPPSLTFIGGLKTNKRAEWVIKAGLNQKLKDSL